WGFPRLPGRLPGRCSTCVAKDFRRTSWCFGSPETGLLLPSTPPGSHNSPRRWCPGMDVESQWVSAARSALSTSGSGRWTGGRGPGSRSGARVGGRAASDRLVARLDRIVQEVAWSPDGQWLVLRTDNGAAGAGDLVGVRTSGD